MWQLIGLHFKNHLLTQHQIDSYNKFITDISEVIAKYGTFEVRVVPQFETGMEVLPECIWEFKFKGPIYKTQPHHTNADKSIERVTPMMCRLRDLTY
jgi:DNA-directed RNA polymerase beta subunit